MTKKIYVNDLKIHYNFLIGAADKYNLALDNAIYLTKQNIFKLDIFYKVVDGSDRLYFCKIGKQCRTVRSDIVINNHFSDEELTNDKLSFYILKDEIESVFIEVDNNSWVELVGITNGTVKFNYRNEQLKFIIGPLNDYQVVYNFLKIKIKKPILFELCNMPFDENNFKLKFPISMFENIIDIKDEKLHVYQKFRKEKIFELSEFEQMVYGSKKLNIKLYFSNLKPLVIERNMRGLCYLFNKLKDNNLYYNLNKLENLIGNRLNMCYRTLMFFLQRLMYYINFEIVNGNYKGKVRKDYVFSQVLYRNGKLFCANYFGENIYNFEIVLNKNECKKFEKKINEFPLRIQELYTNAEVCEENKLIVIDIIDETCIFDIVPVINLKL